MDIRTEMESLPTADGLMPAYVCRPAAPGAHPAVIVVMEAFGLNAHLKDVAERIAREAYVALAPCSAAGTAPDTPAAPINLADRIQCPVLCFFGDADRMIPMDQVRRVDETLKRLKKTAEVKVYKGAGHGFFCNDRASYDPVAAQNAWDTMRSWLGKYLS